MTLKKKIHLLLLAPVGLVFFVIACLQAQDVQKNKPQIDIQKMFTPSGWMGDGEFGRKYVEFSADRTNPHTRADSIRISYRFGPARWGGIYWQNHPDNWGSMPGNNYSGQGFTRVIFWARGERGGEVVEFKVGGISNQNNRYHDSMLVTTGQLSLTKEWKSYTIDLSNADLSSMIGGFCWVASADYNHGNQITFFLDDLVMK